MKKLCRFCWHSFYSEVDGRERIGCTRQRTTPDGNIVHAPLKGWEATVERLPQSDLDLRAPGDACGPEAKHFTGRD
jgi:hypothetical protein